MSNLIVNELKSVKLRSNRVSNRCPWCNVGQLLM